MLKQAVAGYTICTYSIVPLSEASKAADTLTHCVLDQLVLKIAGYCNTAIMGVATVHACAVGF